MTPQATVPPALPVLSVPLTDQAFDSVLFWADATGVDEIILRSGEPLAVRKGSGEPRPLDPRRIPASEISALSRYVYGEFAPVLLAKGHVLNPRHEVRFSPGHLVRCAVEISMGDECFMSFVATMRPLPAHA